VPGPASLLDLTGLSSRRQLPAARRMVREAVQARSTRVRTGSVAERAPTGIGGHQQSRTVQRNRRLPDLQLRQLGRCEGVIRIVVPRVIQHRRQVEATRLRAPSSNGATGRSKSNGPHLRRLVVIARPWKQDKLHAAGGRCRRAASPEKRIQATLPWCSPVTGRHVVG
jgi:hypothetical protein